MDERGRGRRLPDDVPTRPGSSRSLGAPAHPPGPVASGTGGNIETLLMTAIPDIVQPGRALVSTSFDPFRQGVPTAGSGDVQLQTSVAHLHDAAEILGQLCADDATDHDGIEWTAINDADRLVRLALIVLQDTNMISVAFRPPDAVA